MLKNKILRPCSCGSGKKFGKCCGSREAVQAVREISKIAKPCGDCQACCEIVGVAELGNRTRRNANINVRVDVPSTPHGPTLAGICSASGRSTNSVPSVGQIKASSCWSPVTFSPLPIDKTTKALMVYEVREGAVETMPFELASLIDEIGKTDKVVIVPFGVQEGASFYTAPAYGRIRSRKCFGQWHLM